MNKFNFNPVSNVITIVKMNGDIINIRTNTDLDTNPNPNINSKQAITSYNDLMDELKIKYPHYSAKWNSFKFDEKTKILYLYNQSKL